MTLHRLTAFGFVVVIFIGGACALAQSTHDGAPPGDDAGKQPTTAPGFASIPDEFIDPETHLRVLHLTRIPNERSGVIYFTYSCISQDSRLAMVDTQFDDKWRHLYTFDFQTQQIKPLVTNTLTQNQVLAFKSGNLYYTADDAVWAVDIHGGEPRKIKDLPAKWTPGAGMVVNADETMLIGGAVDPEKAAQPSAVLEKPAAKAAAMGAIFAKHNLNFLYTINIKTGELRVIHRIDTWLGHIQCSPTDPDLAMFCHEGPWEKVDRIWLIHLSGGEPTLVYKRTEPHEIVGHEFWAPDGKSVWFQQSFRDKGIGYLTGKNLATGKLTQYTVGDGGKSIHYTWSPDGTFFVGDGSGKAGHGPNKYISLLLPRAGKIKVKLLCSLQNNDYAIEPNPHVSPDNRWVIFTATLFGTPQAYAVEVPPAMLTEP